MTDKQGLVLTFIFMMFLAFFAAKLPGNMFSNMNEGTQKFSAEIARDAASPTGADGIENIEPAAGDDDIAVPPAPAQ